MLKNINFAKEALTDLKQEIPVEQMTYTMDLNIVTDKYSLPPLLKHELLPGEDSTTFADILLQEVLDGD